MQGHQVALDLYSVTGLSESQSLGYAQSCEPREQSLCGTIQFVVAAESSARSLGVCNVDKLTAPGLRDMSATCRDSTFHVFVLLLVEQQTSETGHRAHGSVLV